MFVRHRKTKKLYKVLGSHYDGNRGLLYKLLEEEVQKDKRKLHVYDEQRNYFRVGDINDSRS